VTYRELLLGDTGGSLVGLRPEFHSTRRLPDQYPWGLKLEGAVVGAAVVGLSLTVSHQVGILNCSQSVFAVSITHTGVIVIEHHTPTTGGTATLQFMLIPFHHAWFMNKV